MNIEAMKETIQTALDMANAVMNSMDCESAMDTRECYKVYDEVKADFDKAWDALHKAAYATLVLSEFWPTVDQTMLDLSERWQWWDDECHYWWQCDW